MKKFMILGMMLFAFFSIAIYAQDSECYKVDEEIADCPDWAYCQELSLSINLGYPYDQCDITVRYKERECEYSVNSDCPGMIFKQIMLKGVDWDFGDPDCSYLTEDIFPGYPNDFSYIDETKFANLLLNAQRELSTMLFEDFYNGLSAQDKLDYQCVNPGCEYPSGPCAGYSVIYVNPSCNALCIIYDGGPTGPGEDDFIEIVPCIEEEQTCCEYSRIFCACVDNNGNFLGIKVNETISNVSGDCENSEAGYECPTPGPGRVLDFIDCSNRCPY